MYAHCDFHWSLASFFFGSEYGKTIRKIVLIYWEFY